MEKTTELYKQMEDRLSEIDLETGNNVLYRAQRSYKVVEEIMSELKDFIFLYKFSDQQEEIAFFKLIKPKFYSRLIYFIRLFEIESGYRAGSGKSKKRYLRRKLQSLNRYFKEHSEFYKYWRSGATHLDERYFTRNCFDLYLGLDLSYFDCDPYFTSSHDYKVSMLLANEDLCRHIEATLLELTQPPGAVVRSLIQDFNIGWSETKAGLIELMYALHCSGVFCSTKTNSPVELKQVASFMEGAFGISLGNYSRTFQELSLRKKGQTTFLDKIRDRLIRRMEDGGE